MPSAASTLAWAALLLVTACTAAPPEESAPVFEFRVVGRWDDSTALLDYPDLAMPEGDDDELHQPLFIVLQRQGPVYALEDVVFERPAGPPYLACDDFLSCGQMDHLAVAPGDIDRVTRLFSSGRAVARVAIDAQGRAEVLEVVAAPAGAAPVPARDR